MNIDIKHITKLSRLRIEDDKIEKFEKDMQSIVNMVEQLPDIDDTLTLDVNNAMKLREDVEVTDKYTREQLLKNAPQVQAGCLVVPKIVD